MEIILKVVLDTNLDRNTVKEIIHDKVCNSLIEESSNITLDPDKFSKEDYIEIAEVNLSR